MLNPISPRLTTSPVTQTQRSTTPAPSRSPQERPKTEPVLKKAATGIKPIEIQSEITRVHSRIDQISSSQIQGRAAQFSQMGLVPSGFPRVNVEEIQLMRSQLKPVSQHQVLNLGDVSTGSTTKESALSRKLGSEVKGVPLDRDRLPGADGSIDIVGHSSAGGMKIEGKSPQQLAAHLKNQFGLEKIKTIHLVSCESEHFKAEFRMALADLGVKVDNVEGANGRVAVNQETGMILDEAKVGDLDKISGHSGTLGLVDDLKSDLTITNRPPANMGQFIDNVKQRATALNRNSLYVMQQLDLIKLQLNSAELPIDDADADLKFYYNLNPLTGLVSTKQQSLVLYALGKDIPSPNAGSLNDLQVDGAGISGRPAFAKFTKETIDLIPGQHRRHITAWHSIRGTMNKILANPPHNIDAKLGQMLNNDSIPQVVMDEADGLVNTRYEGQAGKDLEKKVLKALFIMNSNPNNLWAGDGATNSAINTAFNAINTKITPEKLTPIRDQVRQRLQSIGQKQDEINQIQAQSSQQAQAIKSEAFSQQPYQGQINTKQFQIRQLRDHVIQNQGGQPTLEQNHHMNQIQAELEHIQAQALSQQPYHANLHQLNGQTQQQTGQLNSEIDSLNTEINQCLDDFKSDFVTAPTPIVNNAQSLAANVICHDLKSGDFDVNKVVKKAISQFVGLEVDVIGDTASQTEEIFTKRQGFVDAGKSIFEIENGLKAQPSSAEMLDLLNTFMTYP